MVVAGPVQFGFVGGDAANVSPAKAQTIGQAVTLIDTGGCPESKIGEGSTGGATPALNWRVEGSMAYSHGTVASNSRSTASGC
jgi:hypothetical protein